MVAACCCGTCCQQEAKKLRVLLGEPRREAPGARPHLWRARALKGAAASAPPPPIIGA
jgi:hypothetical protein